MANAFSSFNAFVCMSWVCINGVACYKPFHAIASTKWRWFNAFTQNKLFGFDLFSWNWLLCRNVNDVSVAIKFGSAWLHLNITCQLIFCKSKFQQTIRQHISFGGSWLFADTNGPMTQRERKMLRSSCSEGRVEAHLNFDWILFDFFMQPAVTEDNAVRTQPSREHSRYVYDCFFSEILKGFPGMKMTWRNNEMAKISEDKQKWIKTNSNQIKAPQSHSLFYKFVSDCEFIITIFHVYLMILSFCVAAKTFTFMIRIDFNRAVNVAKPVTETN